MPEPRPAPDRPGQAGAPRIASPAAARGPSVKALWLLTAGVFAVLYVATAQRGVSWQDSGMFQFRVWRGDYYGDLGLALAHPLYIAGARAFTALWPGHLPGLPAPGGRTVLAADGEFLPPGQGALLGAQARQVPRMPRHEPLAGVLLIRSPRLHDPSICPVAETMPVGQARYGLGPVCL